MQRPDLPFQSVNGSAGGDEITIIHIVLFDCMRDP